MKNIGFKLLYVITAVVMLIETGFSVKNSLFTDIADLPTGKLLYTEESPSGNKHLNVYVVKNNMGEAVRGEIATKTGSYNIFWQTDIETVDAFWLDEKNVVINDIILDSNDTFGYDCRRGYSLFDEGSLEQNFTNYEEE